MKTRKSKFSIKFKEDLIKEYLKGQFSSAELSDKYGVSRQYIRRLALEYETQGGFIRQSIQNDYSPLFKLKCVLAVLKDRLSLSEASLKFGVPGDSTIFRWIRSYEQLGEAGLAPKPRGRPTTMSVPKKKKKERSSDPKIAEMEDEIEYLRAENAYLKKLSALIQEEELKKSKSKSKPSKN